MHSLPIYNVKCCCRTKKWVDKFKAKTKLVVKDGIHWKKQAKMNDKKIFVEQSAKNDKKKHIVGNMREA